MALIVASGVITLFLYIWVYKKVRNWYTKGASVADRGYLGRAYMSMATIRLMGRCDIFNSATEETV